VSGVGAGPTERWARTPTITLLVQNERGYLNLSELSSIAYLESGEMAEPVVPWAKVVEHAEG
jgi:DNA polymerase-3 subunit alpha